jgi:hypothetical protein
VIPKTQGGIYPGWRLPSIGLDETRRLCTISLAAISATSLDRSETKDMQPALTITNDGINNEVLEKMDEKRPATCLMRPTI